VRVLGAGGDPLGCGRVRERVELPLQTHKLCAQSLSLRIIQIVLVAVIGSLEVPQGATGQPLEAVTIIGTTQLPGTGIDVDKLPNATQTLRSVPIAPLAIPAPLVDFRRRTLFFWHRTDCSRSSPYFSMGQECLELTQLPLV
jgi:hypothetical protein